jgi:hypothetical protein
VALPGPRSHSHAEAHDSFNPLFCGRGYSMISGTPFSMWPMSPMPASRSHTGQPDATSAASLHSWAYLAYSPAKRNANGSSSLVGRKERSA